MKVRYIKEFINGSNSNNGCHWVEVQALDYFGINRALNKTVKATQEYSTNNGDLTTPTNGIISETDYVYFANSSGTGVTITIDLEEVYSINKIKVWHYYVGGRQYKNMLLQVSEDNIVWTPVWNGTSSGVYTETEEGMTHILEKDTEPVLVPTESSSLSEIIDYYSYFMEEIKHYKQLLINKLESVGISMTMDNSIKQIVGKISEMQVSSLPSWYDSGNNSFWITGALMPLGRYQAMTGLVNDKFYVLTGYDSLWEGNHCCYYDIKKNTWITLPDAPIGYTEAASGCVDGKIYCVGGYMDSVGIVDNYYYDVNAATWTKFSKCPSNRCHEIGAAVEGKVYGYGGYYGGDKIDVLDPITLTWSTPASVYASGIYGCSGAALNKKLYIFGNYSSTNRSSAYSFDTITNTWTKLTNTPYGATYSGAVAHRNKVHLLGGAYSYRANYAYDPLSNTWTKHTDMPSDRQHAVSFTAENRLYAVGGGESSGTVKTNVDIYIS